MTEAEAIAAAERVLVVINSQPQTPRKEIIAAAIGYTRTADFSGLTPDELKRIMSIWAKPAAHVLIVDF